MPGEMTILSLTATPVASPVPPISKSSPLIAFRKGPIPTVL